LLEHTLEKRWCFNLCEGVTEKYWDGESFLVACASHGVRAECTVAALRRKFSRFLSNEAVKRAYLLWLRDGDVPRA
jgi:hypothetical protein